jgi:drug/metabolite transporter (DMT)-like permease
MLSALLWSTGGLLIKAVEWNALAIAGSRSAIAAVTLFLLMPRRRLKLSGTQLAAAVLYTATVISFVAANRLTTAANAIFLQYTSPVYIALFGAAWLGERPSRLDWGLIALAQAGIALFFLDHLNLDGMWGNLCALASGLSYAGLTILLRKQKDGSPVDSILAGNILTALIGLPFMLGAWPSASTGLGLLVLGVFQLAIPYWLYALAIKKVQALEASLICVIEPVLNPLWVLLFLGERPQPWALLGGALVLATATARGVLTVRRLSMPTMTPSTETT